MYEKYFGLKEKPFSLTPDPEFLFENEHFQGAFDNIIYGIKRQEGFATIVGDVGTGKTTFCWALLGRLDKSIRSALILNPLLTEEDMLKAIIQDFGVWPQRHGAATAAVADAVGPYDSAWMQGMTRKELVDELNLFLLEGADQGIFNILIVDEAQNLSLGLLEQLRILSNLETAKKKLLQIIFVGQLEFEEKLKLPQLRQLNQRITVRYKLQPLSRKDTIQYIEHRLSVAGSKRSVGFTDGALRKIYAYSRGYPRLINIICDRALLAGYGARTRSINARTVKKALRALSGQEIGSGLRNAGWKRVLVPVLGFLALALMAVTLYWVLGRGRAVVGANFADSAPISPQAAVGGPLSSQPSELSRSMTPERPPEVVKEVAVREEHPAANQVKLYLARNDPSPVPGDSAPVQETSVAVQNAPPAVPDNPTTVKSSPASVQNNAAPPQSNPAVVQGGAAPVTAGETQPAAASAEGGTGGYLLQVHSLVTQDQADAAVDALKTMGFAAFAKLEAGQNGEQWYVVYAGPYPTAERALGDAAALERQQSLKTILRRQAIGK